MLTQHSAPHSGHVLLVDDDENDLFLTRECFEMSKYPVVLDQVSSGQECMAYLRRQGAYQQVETPDLVLLDLKMPEMDGQTVLREISGDEGLRRLPVVVLSHSKDKKDISEMFRLGCQDYIIKTMSFMNLQVIINSLCDAYFSATLTPGNR